MLCAAHDPGLVTPEVHGRNPDDPPAQFGEKVESVDVCSVDVGIGPMLSARRTPHPPSTRASPCRCAARRGPRHCESGSAYRVAEDCRRMSTEPHAGFLRRLGTGVGEVQDLPQPANVPGARVPRRDLPQFCARVRGSHSRVRQLVSAPVRTAIAGRCRTRCGQTVVQLTPPTTRASSSAMLSLCTTMPDGRTGVGCGRVRPGHSAGTHLLPSRAAAERPATVAVLPDHIHAATARSAAVSSRPRGVYTFRYTFVYRWAELATSDLTGCERLGGDETASASRDRRGNRCDRGIHPVSTSPRVALLYAFCE